MGPLGAFVVLQPILGFGGKIGEGDKIEYSSKAHEISVKVHQCLTIDILIASLH